jgi:uncharacterized protein (TIGR03118 family)
MTAHSRLPVLHRRKVGLAAAAVGALALAVPATAADAQPTATGHGFVQTNLVSDVPGLAQITDPNLVNAWGASYLGTSPLWVSDNGTNVTTLYTGGVHGGPQSITPLVVSIPGGAPTGQVSNPTSDFVVTAKDGTTGPAKFIFVGETGHISGWNPAVQPAPGGASSTHAQNAVVHKNDIDKGVAMGMTPTGPRLYVANFHSGNVDMYDGSWKPLHRQGAFSDPTLPRGYAPFNVMVSGNRVYVAYAKADGLDEVDGPGLGRVDEFTLNGFLLHRLAKHSTLDAPWGLAIAPAGFGALAGDLLVGNFGNGEVHAFTAGDMGYRGVLRTPAHRPLVIDGLWALLPGNGTEAGTDEVLFTAGPDDEAHGLLGTLHWGS